MFHKTRIRLTLIYSGVLALTMLALSLLIYCGLLNMLSNNVQNRLDTSANNMSQEIIGLCSKLENGNIPDSYTPLPGVKFMDLPIPLNQFVVVTDTQGAIVITSLKDPQLIIEMEEKIPQSPSEIKNDVNNFDINNRSFALKSYFSYQDRTIYLGLERTDYAILLKDIRMQITMFAVFLLAIASVLGYIFAGRAMSPIINAYKRQLEFTADASHELRTPLSILQSSAEILDELRETMPPIHQTVLTNMKDEIIQMTKLLENLLTLARSDSGKYNPAGEEFDMKKLVTELIQHMQTLAQEKRIRLSVRPPEASSLIYYGDKDRIRQLIYILVDNAIKYNKPEGKVEVDLKRRENNIILNVKDDGYGISGEDLPNIFKRFYRADKDRSHQSGGAGLGLSIAHWIVETHGGKIQVFSRPGQGSNFEIILPVKPR